MASAPVAFNSIEQTEANEWSMLPLKHHTYTRASSGIKSNQTSIHSHRMSGSVPSTCFVLIKIELQMVFTIPIVLMMSYIYGHFACHSNSMKLQDQNCLRSISIVELFGRYSRLRCVLSSNVMVISIFLFQYVFNAWLVCTLERYAIIDHNLHSE